MQISDYPRINVDPAICSGRPVIAGTRVRVRVADILEMLSQGASEAEISTDFPYVTITNIRSCLAYAAGMRLHNHCVIG